MIIYEDVTAFELKLCKGLGLIPILEFLDLPRKTTKSTKFPTYELRTELVNDKEYGGNGELELESAYNAAGDYIGDKKTAKMLADKGITPEAIPGNKVCSIGYSEKDGKWYGWSHRAIAGFEPGDVIKKGDVVADQIEPGYEIKDGADAKRVAIAFAKGVS